MKLPQIPPADLRLLALLGFCLLGVLWTPYDPADQLARERAFAGPSAAHWLGIDALGRDILSRLWAGAGNTTGMALAALALALVIGGGLVSLEQIAPRPLSSAVRALVNVWVAIPVLLISFALLLMLAPSAGTLIVAAALGAVPLVFRQLRVFWLEQSGAPYADAARVVGGDRWHRFRYHLWINLLPDIRGLSKLVFAIAVLELSGLAFLGLIGDPDFPELGAILRQNQAYLASEPWLVILPGLCLSGLLLSTHLSRRT